MDEADWLALRFEEQRAHLRAVAYRMLGSLAEADDAVQNSWLRLSRAAADEVENLAGAAASRPWPAPRLRRCLSHRAARGRLRRAPRGAGPRCRPPGRQRRATRRSIGDARCLARWRLRAQVLAGRPVR